MSEVDFLEIINLHSGNAMDGFAIYATFTFAYITAVYVAGDKLSRLQTVLAASLYLFCATAFVLAAILHLHSFEALVALNPQYVHADLWYFPWSEVAIVGGFSGMALSIYFLMDIRSERRGSN